MRVSCRPLVITHTHTHTHTHTDALDFAFDVLTTYTRVQIYSEGESALPLSRVCYSMKNVPPVPLVVSSAFFALSLTTVDGVCAPSCEISSVSQCIIRIALR